MAYAMHITGNGGAGATMAYPTVCASDPYEYR